MTDHCEDIVGQDSFIEDVGKIHQFTNGPADLQIGVTGGWIPTLSGVVRALQEYIKEIAGFRYEAYDYEEFRQYSGILRSIIVLKPSIGGEFYRDPLDLVSADDGATVIVDARGRRWKRIMSGTLWLNWFEADTTGVIDASTALTKAAAVAINKVAILKANGFIRLSNQVNLRSVRVDFSGATISLDAATPPLLIGGDAQTTVNARQQFKRINRTGGATAEPTVRVMGTKDQTFDIDNVDYLQVYADTSVLSEKNGSIAYCTFNLGRAAKLELTNNPANVLPGPGDGGVIQWINENVFNLQRCANCIISGTYEHNHNRFIGGTFESTSEITILNGWDNYFYDLRFEGTPTVTFAAGTERNTVINTWDSSTANYDQTSATVIDDGFDNIVIDDFTFFRFGKTVAYTDIADVILDTQLQSVGTVRIPDLQKIHHTSAAGVLVDSGFISVAEGDYFRWVTVDPANSMGGANSRYRPRIEFYDVKLLPVTASLDFILSTGGNLSLPSGNTISNGTNVSGAVAVIKKAALAAGVRFVKVNWRSTSPITPAISLAVQMYIVHLTRKSDRYRGYPESNNTPQGVGILVSGIPTKGFAPIGYSAVKSDGTAKYINNFSFETRSTANAVGAATVINVTAGTGTANGDIIGINLDDGTTHWTTIASGGGTTTITLTSALPGVAPTVVATSGTRVVFNRWISYT